MKPENDRFFNEYASQMKSVRMPVTTRKEILGATEPAVQDDAPSRVGATHTAAPRRARTTPSRLRRRVLAVAACTLAIAAGSIALTVVGNTPTNKVDAPATSASSNGFVLAAYADGTPVAGDRAIVETSTLIIPGGGWSTGEDRDEQGNVIGSSSLTGFSMNLRLKGDGIKQVVYRLDGPDGVELVRWGSRENVRTGDPVDDERGKIVTVDGSERMSQSSYSIDVTIPLDDELLALDTTDQGIWPDEMYFACRERSAQVIGQCTLTVTATLDNDSTVTHAYRIAPVENFDQVQRANDEVWRNLQPGEDLQTQPEFTVEQLN